LDSEIEAVCESMNTCLKTNWLQHKQVCGGSLDVLWSLIQEILFLEEGVCVCYLNVVNIVFT